MTHFTTKLRKVLNRRYFPDYMKRSTIHGVSYIVQTDRPLIERFIWLIAIIISVGMGTTYILNAYDKWQTTPVIVTMDDLPTFVQEVSDLIEKYNELTFLFIFGTQLKDKSSNKMYSFLADSFPGDDHMPENKVQKNHYKH